MNGLWYWEVLLIDRKTQHRYLRSSTFGYRSEVDAVQDFKDCMRSGVIFRSGVPVGAEVLDLAVLLMGNKRNN